MRPPRLDGCSYIGLHRYFLTLCTFDRRRLLVSHDVVDVAWQQFLSTAGERGFTIPAYCFMPDHIHLLVEGTHDGADLQLFVSEAKQRAAYALRTIVAGLWQRGYFDRVLRDEEESAAVARYIVQNPVRAGLVRSPLEYPFLGSTLVAADELLESVRWHP